MGQRGSKQHSSLTFGYVDYTYTHLKEKTDVKTSSEDTSNNMLLDYVLNHPELYKLELMCKCTHTTASNHHHHHQVTASTNNDCNEEWIVATQQQECRTCRQNKRMSFVRHHLAKDLEYIDETYYSDIKHYEYAPNDNANSTPGRNRPSLGATTDNLDDYDYLTDDDNNNNDDDDLVNEHWGKITVGEVTSQTSRRTTTLPGADDHQGGDAAAAFTAQSTTFTLNLSGRSLVKLSSGIGYLSNLTKLNLSNNQLSSLPKSIGYLSNLTIFNTAHNQLKTLPDTMAHLTKLKAMNICHNNITHLPPCLGFLPELIIIIANNNQIRWIPNEIANLQQMISFNISNNPLPCLPAEIANIKSLRKLVADGCDFQTEFINQRQHDPPTLFEQCARTIVQHQLTLPNQLPDHIRSYLSTHQACSYCHGPYFESFVTRGRFIERVARQPIALKYNLCRAHWSDDQDRLMNLFSSSSPSVVDLSVLSPSGGGSDGDGGSGMTDTSSIYSSPSTSAGTSARKRSGSGSSNVSSSYPTLPTLPVLPNLDTCSGSNNGNTSSLPAAATLMYQKESLKQEQPQQQQPMVHRSRTNYFTKRFAHFLSPSNNNSSSSSSSSGGGGSNSNIMRSSRSHSSLRQEITPTTTTTLTVGQKENDIHSLGVEQSTFLYHHDGRQQHLASSSFPANENSQLTGMEQQLLLHRVKAGISPTSYTHPDEQQQQQPSLWTDTAIHYGNNDTDGTTMEQHHFMSIPQPTPLHTSPA